ncbi:MAG: HAD family phosphatase [Clostridia bacterium]|nr:HAD family phosphatase [Clostridia bacterium]
MEKIKYAIFDADGTLMDSMHIWDTVDSAFLMMHGIEPKEKRLFRKYGYFNTINRMIEEYNLDMTFDEVKAQIMKILEYYYENVAAAKEGVAEFLKTLRDNGVRCVVATATDRYLMEPALERNGLLRYFDKVFTTRDIGLSKHQPDVFNMARDFMGANENLFIFEDAAYAIDTAKNAGYRVIAVEDYSAEDEREHIIETADYYVKHYSEMYKIFDLTVK